MAIHNRDQGSVRLIAADMDGTLLGGDGRISARTLAALQSAAAAGVRIVIATGRRHGYAMRQLRSLGLDTAHTLISSNGAVVRTLDATLIDRTFLDRAAARRLCAHLGDLRNALVITFDRTGPDGEDARGALVVEELAELHSSIGRWVTANQPFIEQVVPIERALDSREPIQMMLCGTVDRMRRAEQLLLELPGVAAPDHHAPGSPRSYRAFTEGAADRTAHDAEYRPRDVAPADVAPEDSITLHRTEYPERDLSILDILPAGCSKGNAILRLAAGWGVDSTEIMAIGDNWNDLSMLRIAGHPVLMSNAPAELQAIATEQGWRITGSHLDDGAAEAVEAALARDLAAVPYR